MIILIIKALLIGACAVLYRMGGSDEYPKIFRRIGVPALIFINAVFISKVNVFLSLSSLFLLYGTLSMGYGINSKLTKWLKNGYLVRGTVGGLCALANLPILWGNWWLFGFYTIMLVSWMLLNGNGKFKFKAEIEEFAMGLMIASIPILI